MRKPMMAGNWKMNKTIDEAKALAKAIRDAVNDEDGVDCVVCPPFVDLPAVAKILEDSNIEVGAQNMLREPASENASVLRWRPAATSRRVASSPNFSITSAPA